MSLAPEPQPDPLADTVRAFDWMRDGACVETGDVGFFASAGFRNIRCQGGLPSLSCTRRLPRLRTQTTDRRRHLGRQERG